VREIIWRPWQDPVAPLVNGKPEPPYIADEDDDDPDFHRGRESWLGEDESLPAVLRPRSGGLGPGIVTPMGIVPVHESNLPSRLFNFWVGDANFDLTRKVVREIAKVPGVECLDVFSRYRFRIAVGRAFKDRDVRLAIDRLVEPPTPEPPSRDPLMAMRANLSRAFPFWAIFRLPNGRYACVGGQTAAEVKTKAKQYDGAEAALSWEAK
jgi:hypothetical protein